MFVDGKLCTFNISTPWMLCIYTSDIWRNDADISLVWGTFVLPICINDNTNSHRSHLFTLILGICRQFSIYRVILLSFWNLSLNYHSGRYVESFLCPEVWTPPGFLYFWALSVFKPYVSVVCTFVSRGYCYFSGWISWLFWMRSHFIAAIFDFDPILKLFRLTD